MKPLISLSAGALLMSVLLVGGVGCASNPQSSQADNQGGNQPQSAGYHQNAAQPNQSERGDTGNGAFGETPP